MLQYNWIHNKTGTRKIVLLHHSYPCQYTIIAQTLISPPCTSCKVHIYYIPLTLGFPYAVLTLHDL
jgi:hypothetical protein